MTFLNYFNKFYVVGVLRSYFCSTLRIAASSLNSGIYTSGGRQYGSSFFDLALVKSRSFASNLQFGFFLISLSPEQKIMLSELNSDIPLDNYIFLAFSLQVFLFGLVGIAFNRHNFISLLISVEIMFLGIILFFVGILVLRASHTNFAVPVMLLAIAACESAIGLSIIAFMYKQG